MYRNGYDQQWKKDELEQGFQRMEGEGCEGGRVYAVMMHFMDGSENPGAMHPSVKPIVVGFIKQEVDSNASKKVQPSKRACI